MTVGFRLRGQRKDLEQAIERISGDREIELRPWPSPGGWPVPLAKFVNKSLLKKYAKIGTRIERLEGIRGGEVVPHSHLGDDVIYLKRDDFQQMIGDVARQLAIDFTARVDFDKTVNLMAQFAIDTIPMPE
jgi:hypothetical protein